MSSPVDVPAETDAPGAATTTTRKHDGRPRPRTVLIGLSGPSSSGKTTLARLLRSIFTPPTTETETGCKLSLFVLHEDDFYKTDTE
jgi:nicotinamide/nicotinate riboside kinase